MHKAAAWFGVKAADFVIPASGIRLSIIASMAPVGMDFSRPRAHADVFGPASYATWRGLRPVGLRAQRAPDGSPGRGNLLARDRRCLR